MSYDNLSNVSQNVLKFYQQLTGEERRIPFIFDDFHFCRSRVIGLDMTENRIFTRCRMITLVVFLGMFFFFLVFNAKHNLRVTCSKVYKVFKQLVTTTTQC